MYSKQGDRFEVIEVVNIRDSMTAIIIIIIIIISGLICILLVVVMMMIEACILEGDG